jgi:hypothetical protein
MIINFLLTFFLVLIITASDAYAVSSILGATLVYRILPDPYGAMVAGIIAVFAGMVARRNITRRDSQ